MKIVYCLPDTYHPGGIERVVSLKANYLADVLGYNVSIITTGQLSKPSFYKFSDKICFYDLGINYSDFLNMSIFKKIYIRILKKNKHKFELNLLLKKINADIVISTFTHETSFITKIKDGSLKILEFHFHKGFKQKFANSFNVSFLTKLGYSFNSFLEEHIYIKRFDAFVVLTNEDKMLWSRINKNVIVIPNILSFKPLQISKLNSKIAIAVGRLDSQKGFDRLIELWGFINKKCNDWILHIYGDGPDLNFLLHLIKKNNLEKVISIFPSTNIIQSKYQEASLFLMTSRYEGMPMTLLESRACGLPSVSYNFKCGPKDIINDGIDGFLIQDDNKEEFVSKTVLLMKNNELRIQFGNKAKENVEKYSVDIIMNSWITLFDELLNKNIINN